MSTQSSAVPYDWGDDQASLAERLRPPGNVIEIARTLQNAGYEAWCVGGAVRDALLGHEHLDWDLATSARPEQVRKLFKRTIPVGIEFGTVGVLDRDGVMHEVTTFRRDVQTDGRHAVVEFGASLDDDLARRDFTINAIAWDPIAKVLRDPFHGRQDLARAVVRAVGVARERLIEDRLRALRAIRFASRFDFTLDDATWNAVVESAPFLTRLSPERVKQELEKTLEQAILPSRAFMRWRDAGAFASVIPALASISNVQLRSVDALPRPVLRTRPLRKSLRLAALFAGLEGKTAEHALRALRFPNLEIGVVGSLVDRWFRLRSELTERLTKSSPSALDSAYLRRLAADVGRTRVSGFVRLAASQWHASQQVEPAQVRELYRALVHTAFHDPIEIGDLALDGDDLRRMGISPGPALGRTLQVLMAYVIEDPSRNTYDTLRMYVEQLRGTAPSNGEIA
ncbi:MAG: CCA tRNA nucleotidyltransferase [Gemmatimonadaceae bacterium]|nr:CCA tRNA nucleotidyltransferase [Gemmatimonadaceae bacterium]